MIVEGKLGNAITKDNINIYTLEKELQDGYQESLGEELKKVTGKSLDLPMIVDLSVAPYLASGALAVLCDYSINSKDNGMFFGVVTNNKIVKCAIDVVGADLIQQYDTLDDAVEACKRSM